MAFASGSTESKCKEKGEKARFSLYNETYSQEGFDDVASRMFLG